MPLRPVPWFTTGGVEGEGGAENLGELARADSFVGSSGATGIVDPLDFEVVPIPQPGPFVRVRKGTGVIRSTYPGVFGQSYIVQEESFEDIPIEATGSGATATKYVYVLIEDSQYPGSPTPADLQKGPYNRYAVTTTLPQNVPFLLLARIDQPKSTAAIEKEHIVDMREVANPLEKTVVFPRPNILEDISGNDLVLNSRSAFPDGEWFPNVGGNLGNGRFDVEVPTFATKMQIRCEWLGVGLSNNPGAGMYWVSFGPDGGSNSPVWHTQGFGWNSTSGAYVTNWILHQEVHVRPEWRGTKLAFFPRANKTTDTSYPGVVKLSARSGMVLSIRFIQMPDQEDIQP